MTAIGAPHSTLPLATHWPPGPAIRDLAAHFLSISLADTQRAALMDRVEQKYLTSLASLGEVLRLLPAHYQALEIEGERLQHYVSVYHDTTDFAMYLAHHNGRARRCKVRTRQYGQTGQTFLELKLRDVTGRTRKERVAVTGDAGSAVIRQTPFVQAHLPRLTPTSLAPTLAVQCDRLTLVGRTHDERLTFDLHLTLSAARGACSLDGLVVIELKRAASSSVSPFRAVARHLGLREQGFSKYGVGCALLYPHLKRNAFKPALLSLTRLAQVQWQATAGSN
ncbi:polyphosphate polymerase domain-containing protein [Deinococcus radiotolerans]|uniref:VTC domain-containing protein n=1 Tax=Deinococcus radiotolerans TaxID=1309407 RepID=A0ABQ2FLQ4_9DEIO|nr:polyphosphate polymerase domain-containing protein [Deinococcus radiotolerans]GGL08585.1 VTC domain-containing protein [Deinococcus radiotolerans]